MQFSDCEKYWFTISHPENMKPVGWCAVLSSPESSPEKMWRQECFHRYEDRNTRPRECAPASEPPIHPPSIPQPIVLGGYCGGASPSSSPGMAMLDPAPDAERRQGGVKRRRTRELRRAVSSGAPATVAEVKDQLDVVEQTTSGFQNNCLWFSTQLAMGRLTDSEQYSEEAEAASAQGRQQIYEELERVWPVTDRRVEGPNHSWWAGCSWSSLADINDFQLMMGEAHLFALAHLLQRPIVLVEWRAPSVSIVRYSPGYVVQPPLTFSEALLAREDPTCVWVRLHADHFRGLVPSHRV